jgi:hypothetical protein
MTEEQIMTIARQYGNCMRDHGIAGYKDGRLENGRLTGAGVAVDAGAPGTAPTEAQMEAASTACQPIFDKLPASVTAPEPPPSAEELAKMAKFAQCLRTHGFPDWPDPDSRGAFLVPDSKVAKTDKFQAAKDECKQFYDGRVKVSDGSGKK